MYRFSGMGLLPGSGRVVYGVSTTSDLSTAGRDAGIDPLVRTGGIPAPRPTPFGYPDLVAPESVPATETGEDGGPAPTGAAQVIVSSAPATSVAVANSGDSFISSVPWWGWGLAGLAAGMR